MGCLLLLRFTRQPNRLEGAYLDAKSAPVAKRGIDERLPAVFALRTLAELIESKARAADFRDALLAPRANVAVDGHGRTRFHQLNAGRLEQDCRRPRKVDCALSCRD